MPRPQEIYLLQPNDVRLLPSSEAQAQEACHASLHDILSIAGMLSSHCALPCDVVNSVLSYCGLFMRFEVETEDLRRGYSNMNELYLTLSIPSTDALKLPAAGVQVGRCEQLLVDCASRDQGWASMDQEFNGTYQASYTWTEIEVVPPIPTEAEPLERVELTPNVRANRFFRCHRKLFNAKDDLTQHVVPGSSIRLFLRSQYPAWTNSANYARIQAFFSIEIDEDFAADGKYQVTNDNGSQPQQRCIIQ